MQPKRHNSIKMHACPTHDQCKIHEVYASRNKILLGHKSEVLKTYWQYLKNTKRKCYKSIKVNKTY